MIVNEEYKTVTMVNSEPVAGAHEIRSDQMMPRGDMQQPIVLVTDVFQAPPTGGTHQIYSSILSNSNNNQVRTESQASVVSNGNQQH